MPIRTRDGVIALIVVGTGIGLGWLLLDIPGAVLVGLGGGAIAALLLRAPPAPEPEPDPPDVVEVDRIESLGVLAGGIAHDFNNLLTGILGNANLALTELEPGPARESVEEIELAARRAHELVAQLLAYAGQGQLEVQAVHLGDLVREMIDLLKRVIDPRAQLDVRLPDTPALVEADPRQLRQIVMNLLTNASDALGSAPGEIHVQVAVDLLSRIELDEIELGRELPTGAYVRLEVRDTGSGMDRETLGRIFEPFFTTKFTGRGLGLAALRGIVRHHMGCLQVESEPGRGSRFRVWLPLAEQLDEDEDIPTEHGGQIPHWKLRAGTILLAEDEDIVRRAATRMLSKLGFDVVTAVDGNDALRAFSEDPTEFSLVLLDVQMPGSDGIEALDRIRAIRSDIPAILCTGFARQDVAPDARPDAWLQKPFSLKELVAALDTAQTHHAEDQA